MKPRLLTFCLIFTITSFTLATTAFGQRPDYPTPPEAERQEGVPVGTLTRGTFADSKIYPGTKRDYAIYIPEQHQATDEGAALMVFQDGDGFCNDRGGSRAHIVFDNLIHEGSMPATIGLFINPGVMPPIDPEASVQLDGMCVNSSGNLLVSSSQGLQIFDPRGRILIVLPRPHVTDNRINYVTFGGPDRKTLYIATSGTIYKRPAKSFQGVDPTRPSR